MKAYAILSETETSKPVDEKRSQNEIKREFEVNCDHELSELKAEVQFNFRQLW